MPVTQEFLINLSAVWLGLIISWKFIVWISGDRGSEK